MVAFPLSPAPAYFTYCGFSKRNGVYYVGDTPTITLATAGATGYTVRDYYGTIVSTGTMTGTTVAPTAPAGGWPPGWYRIYFTGPDTDSVFGPSYAVTNFAVIRADAHFPTMPAAGSGTDSAGGENPDFCAKGVLGIGTSRLQIGDVTNLTSGLDNLAAVQANIILAKQYWSNVTPADPHRPRPLFVSFPNGTVDSLTLLASDSIAALVVYCRDGSIDGSTVTITCGPGTSSGIRIIVTQGATVETYDNLPSDNTTIAETINAASAIIRCFRPSFNSPDPPAPIVATAIGNARFNGVKTVVQTVYPDVQWYEGPSNEPRIDTDSSRRGGVADPAIQTAHEMILFTAAVKAGNAGANAMGPTPVSLFNPADADSFDRFIANGGSAADGYAIHIYNNVLGDLHLGRYTFSSLWSVLATRGQTSKPVWQTEQGILTPIYGVHHPRRARWQLLQTLLLEQYGIPREQNNVWYDRSHGYWAVPCWWQNDDASLQPQAVMLRVLAEETWGKPFASALSFGADGDDLWLGSVYTNPTDTTSTVVLLAASYLPNGSVTLQLAGSPLPASVTVVDGFGTTSTATVSTGGLVTIPATGEIPTYVRLPAGITATVHTINGWGGDLTQQHDALTHYAGAISGTTTQPGLLISTDWPTVYDGNLDQLAATVTLPGSVQMKWDTPRTFDRLVIWSAPPWQSQGGLVDFDVQTSDDGSTWTTRATVTKTTPSSFKFGADYHNTGCQYDTYWDEQWVFDVALPAPVTAKYVRLYVRSVSYGGEPDAPAVTAGGQGTATPTLTLQKLKALCDANGRKQFVLSGT